MSISLSLSFCFVLTFLEEFLSRAFLLRVSELTVVASLSGLVVVVVVDDVDDAAASLFWRSFFLLFSPDRLVGWSLGSGTFQKFRQRDGRAQEVCFLFSKVDKTELRIPPHRRIFSAVRSSHTLSLYLCRRTGRAQTLSLYYQQQLLSLAVYAATARDEREQSERLEGEQRERREKREKAGGGAGREERTTVERRREVEEEKGEKIWLSLSFSLSCRGHTLPAAAAHDDGDDDVGSVSLSLRRRGDLVGVVSGLAALQFHGRRRVASLPSSSLLLQ